MGRDGEIGSTPRLTVCLCELGLVPLCRCPSFCPSSNSLPLLTSLACAAMMGGAVCCRGEQDSGHPDGGAQEYLGFLLDLSIRDPSEADRADGTGTQVASLGLKSKGPCRRPCLVHTFSVPPNRAPVRGADSLVHILALYPSLSVPEAEAAALERICTPPWLLFGHSTSSGTCKRYHPFHQLSVWGRPLLPVFCWDLQGL